MTPVLPPAALVIALVLAAVATFGAWPQDAYAEYGDVLLNKRSERAGVRPVVFPHWFHRIRFQCKVCHSELGFKMRAGANDVLMADIIDGKFCGMCHNGQIAWGAEQCDLCHSGRRGLKSGIYGGHETRGPGKW
jgi:c(7)-type cytochrome triheme protein